MSASIPRGSVAHWIEACRPRTLPAAIAPVLVASALAAHDGRFGLVASLLCLSFALLIQIGTNLANDYFDFKKGADTAERVGPRRAVAAGLIAPEVMRRAMITVFVAAFLVGLGLLPFGGWPLLLIGLASIFCGVVYTGGPYPLAYHGWGDVFVFVFFGLVAVGATYFVQAGGVSDNAWWLGALIGALSTNILVVNNYRDIETDRKADKRTLAVRFGSTFAEWQFVAAHVVGVVALTVLWRGGLWGTVSWAILSLVALIEGVRQTLELRRAEDAPALIRLLGRTGRHVAVMALLVAVVLVS
ncbi:MAG: 1,4-dihydroxy-2-naphthoate polyprenyltransferase [Opitutaceae bacterium]|jgi:1,4-dihydroxy-2-naphthoate polyprenyltransferase|nr:1,4-dihydroxy-2-naphthoate polyprenyltransferase [Opitutaceae bacterium]